jgi:O-antigen/teichoic acid export membrane protein
MVQNIFSNWFGLVFNALLGFVLTPLLIHHLGAVNFGLWALITSVLGYYGLLDFGTRTALFRFVARYKGAEDRRELDRTFMSALAITLIVSGIIAISSAALSPVLPGLLKLQGATSRSTQQLLLILGPAVGLSLFGRFLGAYLNGFSRFDLCNVAAVTGCLLRAGLIVVALYSGYGILGVGLAELATAIFSVIVQWCMILRVDRKLALAWNLVSTARIRELVGFSIYVFVSMTGDYLRLYSSSLIIARILSVGLLAPFNIATRLLEYFKTLMVALCGPIMGVLCELDGQRRGDDFARLFLGSTRLTMSLSCLAGLMFFLDGKPLLNLWLGPEYADSAYPVLIVMVLGYVVAQGQHPTLPALMARAKHPPAAFLLLAEGVASVILSIWWAPRWGLIGVAWGTVIPILAARTVVQPWYAIRALGISARDYLTDGMLRPIAATAVFFTVHYIVGFPPPELSPSNGIVILAGQLALAGILGFLVVLKYREQQYLWTRLKVAVRCMRIHGVIAAGQR